MKRAVNGIGGAHATLNLEQIYYKVRLNTVTCVMDN